MENQRHRRQAVKTSFTNVILPKTVNQTIHSIFGTIHNDRIIELNNDIIVENSANTILLNQQSAEYQFYFKSRRKQQHCLNISSTTSINEIVENYIGPMDVFCTYCHPKHFTAKKIFNKAKFISRLLQLWCNLFGIITSISTISS